MNYEPRGGSRRPNREVRDGRKPAYTIFILDTSSSMNDYIEIAYEGSTKRVRKIDELNQGLADSLRSLRSFETENVLYKLYFQIIQLDTYGKALFDNFMPLSRQSEKIVFEANGVTCLENSLATAKKFLNSEYLPGCNRAVNVILMSDGHPTDTDGNIVQESVYTKTIRDFKDELETRGIKGNVDLYAIGVGKDCDKKMLKTFADEGRYYELAETASLRSLLSFVTRVSFGRFGKQRVVPNGGVLRSSQRRGQSMARSRSVAIGNSVLSGPPGAREIDLSICRGSSCLACLNACKLGAIQHKNGLVSISPSACIGCGGCEGICPSDAIRIVADDEWGDW